MKITIQNINPHKLHPRTKQKLGELTFGDDGQLKDLLYNNTSFITSIHIARNSHKRVVGWGCMTRANGFMLYVDEKYRCRSVGKALLAAAVQKVRVFKVYPHDEESYGFYGSVRNIYKHDRMRYG